MPIIERLFFRGGRAEASAEGELGKQEVRKRRGGGQRGRGRWEVGRAGGQGAMKPSSPRFPFPRPS